MAQDKQLPPDAAANVAALAAKQLGTPTPAAAPGATPPDTPPSDLDKVTAAGAPVDEGKKQDQPPITYKININGEDRDLSPEQIGGTFERYAKMNDMNSAMRPVLSLAANAMKANPGLTPQMYAKSLIEMANKHNPEMGGDDQRPNKAQNQKPQSAEEISKGFEKWEADNSATLPPGYKEMHAGNARTEGQMQQLMMMMQKVLGRSQGNLDQATAAAGDANTRSVDAAKQRIANNLQQAQQKLGLPDEAEQEFLSFASERGYTMEDFLDPMLTLKVANDYKNGIQSGEVARLKETATRRQAFTGTIPAQPAAGGDNAPAEDPKLAGLIDKKLGVAG